MALSPKQVAQLAKEQERLNKLQADFYAAQEAGDKKAVKEAARLMKLTNGRLDKLGNTNDEVNKYYNTMKKQLDVSGEITKATQNRATLLAESNVLSQLDAQAGTKSARQQELQSNAASKLFGLKQGILGITNAEALDKMAQIIADNNRLKAPTAPPQQFDSNYADSAVAPTDAESVVDRYNDGDPNVSWEQFVEASKKLGMKFN